MSFHSHEHNHSHQHGNNRHVLIVSLSVIFGFMLIEALAGWLTNSLALLSDAGHMFSDAASLGAALLAFKLAERPADSNCSYGYQRVEILAATFNGLTLVIMAAWIIFEAILRFFSPPKIASAAMLTVAILGLLVNLFIAWYMLNGSDTKENINMRGAFLHVIGDLLGSVGAITAGILMLLFNWTWADPLASVFVALMIGRSGWNVLRDSLHILMEGTPANTDLVRIAEDIQKVNGVLGVHDLHAWTITSQKHAMSCHIVVQPELSIAQANIVIQQVQKTVENHGIGHVTVQAEPPMHDHQEDGCVGDSLSA